jgi:hypothetical protein
MVGSGIKRIDETGREDNRRGAKNHRNSEKLCWTNRKLPSTKVPFLDSGTLKSIFII